MKFYTANNLKLGSIELQILLLNHKINNLKKHFNNYLHDYQSKKGLIKIISKRRKLFKYLKKNKPLIYDKLKKN